MAGSVLGGGGEGGHWVAIMVVMVFWYIGIHRFVILVNQFHVMRLILTKKVPRCQ